jgi:hypothetical protein
MHDGRAKRRERARPSEDRRLGDGGAQGGGLLQGKCWIASVLGNSCRERGGRTRGRLRTSSLGDICASCDKSVCLSVCCFFLVVVAIVVKCHQTP